MKPSRTAWRLRFTSMLVMCAGSAILADGLRSAPNESQVGIPLAPVFPWGWLLVSGLWGAAIAADLTRRQRNFAGFRLSTFYGLLAVAVTLALATARGIAWAIDFAGWHSRSVWGVWTFMAGLCISQLSLAWRLIHDRGAR